MTYSRLTDCWVGGSYLPSVKLHLSQPDEEGVLHGDAPSSASIRKSDTTNPTRLFNQATRDAADLCLCQLCASFVTASARQMLERRASLSSCCCYATTENQFQLLCPFTEVEVFLT